MITKEPIDTGSLPDSGSFKGGGGGLGLIGLTGLEDRNSCCDQLDYSVRSSSTRDPCPTDQGGFQLLDLIINELKSYMTC